ncbi:MAG: hypothetical protein WCH85_01485 [Methanomicrobiales archaeon]
MTKKESAPDCISPGPGPDATGPHTPESPSEFNRSNSLERIIDLTDEMAHLNELILMHLDSQGGFTTPEAYFATVQPVLDLLEVEIGVRYHPGMTITEIKLVVQDWIDCEMAELRRSR